MDSSLARLRVVPDCNILLQAAAHREGPSGRCFDLARSIHFDLFASRTMFQKFRATASKPAVRTHLPSLTPLRIRQFVVLLERRAQFVRRVARTAPIVRDAKDQIYLDLAAAVGADFLITRDHDLLDLMTQHTIAAKEFRSRSRPLRIVTPVGFLRDVERRGYLPSS